MLVPIRWKPLRSLFGTYPNQDVIDDYGDLQSAVIDFRQEASVPMVSSISATARDLAGSINDDTRRLRSSWGLRTHRERKDTDDRSGSWISPPSSTPVSETWIEPAPLVHRSTWLTLPSPFVRIDEIDIDDQQRHLLACLFGGDFHQDFRLIHGGDLHPGIRCRGRRGQDET